MLGFRHRSRPLTFVCCRLPMSARAQPGSDGAMNPSTDAQTPGHRSKPFDPAVYLVTDRRVTPGWTVEQIVEASIGGDGNNRGVTFVQLRDKQETFESSLQLGKKLREITRRAGVPFVVNDDVALAKALHADGVHVGQEDTLAVDARAALGPSAIVGVSAGTSEEARQAIADGADYIGVGAVFATPSKADAGDPIGPHGLHEIVDAVEGQIPVVAIGGISVDNAQQCWEAGASGVAVISAVMKSEVPGVSAAQLHRQK